MKKRKLGNSRLEVSAIGLGCIGMSYGYGPAADKKEMISLIHADIDLYYQHRVDPNAPIEELAGVMQNLIKEVKIRYWGLSEAVSRSLQFKVNIQ